MSKEMIIAPSPHETKVVLLEDGQVVEFFVEREQEIGLVGSIYKGRVTRVLPGMQSAFVDVGLDRDAFLYVSDFFEGLEEYDASPEIEPTVEAPAVEEPEPVAEPQPAPPEDDDRQPPNLTNEPALALPERQPGRRPRRRGGRSRHRGGRRPMRDRQRPPFSTREAPRVQAAPQAPATPAEPLILPGESLAKYRARVSQPEPRQTPEAVGEAPPAPPLEATEPEVASTAKEPATVETVAAPSPKAPQPPQADEAFTAAVTPMPEEIPASETRTQETAAPVLEGKEPPTQLPAEEEPAPSAVEEPALPPVEAAPAGEKTGSEVPEGSPLPNGYPDAITLAEIERVRQYEDQVALPPSVKERTAGGVEWDKRRRPPRDRDRSGGRGRARGRGRGRGRDGGARGRGGRTPPSGEARQEGRPRRERRFPHARPSRGQPAIAELLKAGQEIIVQIAKEQMGKKGARITSHVTLPGRFLVYMPTIDHIGISRRIGTSEERNRLRRLLLELKGTISGGFVVRTAAAGCSEEDLRRDVDYLVKLWHDMRVRADEQPAPTLLHRDLGLVERLLRDHLTTEYESVWVESEEEYTQVLDLVAQFQPELTRRVKLYSKPAPIFEEMGVQQEIDRALRPKVWLKSGGYIVINQTEALVAIDVNTGKFVGKGSTRLEDTIVKTNVEAIEEIVRQIRLRDLGGIIIIDFIDMEDSRNRQKVMRALEAALRNDRSPSKILSFNEFGLVAITRKRSRQSLERLLCQPCPICTGTGLVKSIQTLGYEIQIEVLKMAENIDAPELTIRAHPEIVRALKSRENTLVREMEETSGKNIILQSDNALHIEEYNIY